MMVEGEAYLEETGRIRLGADFRDDNCIAFLPEVGGDYHMKVPFLSVRRLCPQTEDVLCIFR